MSIQLTTKSPARTSQTRADVWEVLLPACWKLRYHVRVRLQDSDRYSLKGDFQGVIE